MTRVAVAHDYLTQRGGAERVALTLARAFDAPLYTTVWDRDRCYPEARDVDVRTSPLDRVGPLRRDPRRAFPLLAPVVSAMSVDADVVICSSSGWAHGVSTRGRRLVYCYTPARWLYRRDDFDVRIGVAGRTAAWLFGPPLRAWDRRAARRADRYLAISTASAREIRSAYGIDAEIVHPPVMVDVEGEQRPVADLEPGYALCIARDRGYKNTDAVVAAAGRPRFGGRTLVVVGATPQSCPVPGVRLLGRVDDATLRWLYAHAGVLVAAAREDFGLTPVEAATAGVPTVALRAGGYLDTVVENTNGIFFDEVEPDAIAAAVDEAYSHEWDAQTVRRSADRFDEAGFVATMRRHVEELAP